MHLHVLVDYDYGCRWIVISSEPEVDWGFIFRALAERSGTETSYPR